MQDDQTNELKSVKIRVLRDIVILLRNRDRAPLRLGNAALQGSIAVQSGFQGTPELPLILF
jgi:hypothetical protein